MNLNKKNYNIHVPYMYNRPEMLTVNKGQSELFIELVVSFAKTIKNKWPVSILYCTR